MSMQVERIDLNALPTDSSNVSRLGSSGSTLDGFVFIPADATPSAA